jgi:hypothetical protein
MRKDRFHIGTSEKLAKLASIVAMQKPGAGNMAEIPAK